MPKLPETPSLPAPHTIMARAFDTPDKVRALAREMGVSPNHAYKWLRGGGTGAPSDLDRVCKMIFLAATFGEDGMRGAGLIADYFREFYVALVEMSAEPYGSDRERVADGTELLREAADAVEALSLGKPNDETVTQLVRLRDMAEQAINRLSASQEVKS